MNIFDLIYAEDLEAYTCFDGDGVDSFENSVGINYKSDNKTFESRAYDLGLDEVDDLIENLDLMLKQLKACR